MAASSSGTRWADPADWEEHRRRIEELYWEQDLPLREVIEIMAREHNFHATTKMYKSRFKTWGLRKSGGKALEGGKAEPPSRLVFRHRAVTAAKGTSLAVTRGLVGPVRVQRSARSKAAPADANTGLVRSGAGRHVYLPGSAAYGWDGQHQHPHHNAAGRAAAAATAPARMPMLATVSTPPILRVPEECMRAIVGYTHGRFEAGAWAAAALEGDADAAVTATGAWANRASIAKEAIQRGRTRAGFRMLDICFRQLRDLLLAHGGGGGGGGGGDVTLLQKSLGVAFYLLEVGDDLALAFARYAAALAAAVLGEAHPLARIWHVLHVLGVDGGLRRHARRILDAQTDALAAWLGPDSRFLSVHRLEVARTYHRWGVVPTAQARDQIAAVVAQMLADVDYWTWDYVLWAQLELATVFVNAESYAEAEGILREIGARVAVERAGLDIWTMDVYYKLRAQVKGKLGMVEEATNMHIARVRVCLEMAGPEHRQTVRAKADLELHYREIGRADVAEKLREEFEAQWGRICEQEGGTVEKTEPDESQGVVAPPQFDSH